MNEWMNEIQTPHKMPMLYKKASKCETQILGRTYTVPLTQIACLEIENFLY